LKGKEKKGGEGEETMPTSVSAPGNMQEEIGGSPVLSDGEEEESAKEQDSNGMDRDRELSGVDCGVDIEDEEDEDDQAHKTIRVGDDDALSSKSTSASASVSVSDSGAVGSEVDLQTEEGVEGEEGKEKPFLEELVFPSLLGR